MSFRKSCSASVDTSRASTSASSSAGSTTSMCSSSSLPYNSSTCAARAPARRPRRRARLIPAAPTLGRSQSAPRRCPRPELVLSVPQYPLLHRLPSHIRLVLDLVGHGASFQRTSSTAIGRPALAVCRSWCRLARVSLLDGRGAVLLPYRVAARAVLRDQLAASPLRGRRATGHQAEVEADGASAGEPPGSGPIRENAFGMLLVETPDCIGDGASASFGASLAAAENSRRAETGRSTRWSATP